LRLREAAGGGRGRQRWARPAAGADERGTAMIEGSYQGFDVALARPGVALVTFGHPERLGALSFGARRDLVEVLTLAQLDDAVRVVVLTGTGRGFVAGVNNRPADEDPTLVPGRPPAAPAPVNLYGQLVHFAQDPVRTIRRLDKLTIAAVNGYAIQLGLSIALACDFALAARSAQLGSATLRMGWQPDEGGHWLLVEHLGVKGALDFLLRKRIVAGEEACRLGLVNEVVDDDALVPRALDLAVELASGPQVAMRLLKKAVYNAARLTFDQAGDDIASKTAISDHHQDAIDGSAAFFAKEEPVFNRWLEEPG
ncbi:MAG TPA: enoyl-CoA hydratase/isomerase family protein, partial [Acidimicrobiales bacterium]|nr:enoyl-CoA hydratase/isomerase family protein [Acidimicrobiales bacterium]